MSPGRWRAAITIEGGRRKYLFGTTRQEVAKKLSAARIAQDQGLLVTAPSQPLARFLDRWLKDSVANRVRPWTYKGYEAVVRNHINPTLGNVRLDRLAPQQVQALVNQKLASGLAPKTVASILGILRNALGQANRWELVARNVAKLVDPPRQVRHEIQPFTVEEARVLLDAAQTDRLGALYSVALAMGLRQGEALGLRWKDVDLDLGMLQVTYQLQRINGEAKLVEPKTRLSRRSLALPATILVTLREHRQLQVEERLLAGRRWVESGLVFTSTIGTPLDGTNVTKSFQRLLAKAGLPKRRFHDLRHSCATLLLVQNVAPRVVMEVLGHSQISLTMNTYSHVLPTLKREAALKMDAVLRGGRERGD